MYFCDIARLAGEKMQGFAELHARLSKLGSDAEVANALKEFFASFCEVASANRFPFLETAGKRNFLIKFKGSTDMIKATNQCNLRSFGFDGVLIEVESRF